MQPALPAGWTVDTSDPQAVTLSIGTAPAQQQLVLRYTVSPAAFSASVTAGLELDVAGLGITGTAQVTVDGTGLRLAAITIGIDPAKPLVIGGAETRRSPDSPPGPTPPAAPGPRRGSRCPRTATSMLW